MVEVMLFYFIKEVFIMTNNSNNNNATEVKRNLRSRHISMIAIGGCQVVKQFKVQDLEEL